MKAQHPPVHGICRPVLLIRRDGRKHEMKAYTIARLWDRPVAYRLTRSDGSTIDVTVTEDGAVECSCADAVYRERVCKHAKSIRSLRESGILQ